jgi:cytochrome P450 family 144
MGTEIPGTSLLDPAVLDNPYPFYEQLQTEAPVWGIPETGVFLVGTYGLLAEAARRVEDFSSNMRCLLYRDETGLPGRFDFGDIGGQVLATADPPLHATHRSAIFPELVAKRMEALDDEITELAETLVDAALELGRVDFMSAIGNVVPITMISRLIGFRESNLEELWAGAVQMTRLIGGTLGLDELIECASRGDQVMKWIADQVDNAVASEHQPHDDLLGTVARGVHEGVFAAADATGALTTLLSAGGESTTSLLGNAVRILAERPVLQEQLRRKPHEISTFIEEALRIESPFRYLMRSVPKDTSLDSVAIPAGSTVLLLWGAANRDPSEFERPSEINLSRRIPRRHVAFGRGIHHCVGAPLARIEARNVLTVLLERTSNFTLDPEQSPVWESSLLVRRHRELPVLLTER